LKRGQLRHLHYSKQTVGFAQCSDFRDQYIQGVHAARLKAIPLDELKKHAIGRDALETLRQQQAGHSPILDPKDHRNPFERLKSIPDQLGEIERLERSVRQEADRIKAETD
jgi:hypothetical protein